MARTVGSKNKSTREVKVLMDQISASFGRGDKDGMAKAIHCLYERAHGVLAERQVMGQPIVYEVPPDTFAIKTLMEFRFGKAKETVEIQDPNEKFKHSPQVILVPPMSFIKKDGHD